MVAQNPNKMRNEAPSRSLARRTYQLVFMAFIVGAVSVFVIAFGIFLYYIPIAAPDTPLDNFQSGLSIFLFVVGGIAFLTALGLAIRALTRRRENDLALITGEHLGQYLDERYRFIRNINRPKLGYIDAVLVGPPGILVFRILNTKGELLNEKNGWVKRKQGQWVAMNVNPTKEAIVDVNAVRNFLAEHKLTELDVYGVVVFVTEQPELVFKLVEPVVPAAHLSKLLDTLKGNYLAKERMDQRLVNRVTELLLGDA